MNSSKAGLALATVFVAAAGYLVLVLAARLLGPVGYFEFSVFWAGLYLVAGSIFGVQQETTRGVRAGVAVATTRSIAPLWPALTVGAGVAALVLGSSPLWAGAVFPANAPPYVLLIAAGAVVYSGFAVTAGALGGVGAWRSYSLLLVGDAGVRVVLVVAVSLVLLSSFGLAVATVSAMAVWLLFLLSRTARKAVGVVVEGSFWLVVSRMLQSLVASAASAVLITGFPIILAATAWHDQPARLAVVVLVVTIVRAPIMLPLNAYMGMIVASFVENPTKGIRMLAKPVLAILSAGMVFGVLAALVGRPLLGWIFGDGYDTEGWFIGVATFAASLVAVLTLTGAAVLARGRHTPYLIGWVAAAAAAGCILATNAPLEPRVVVALTVAPLVGTAIHVTVLLQGRSAVAGTGQAGAYH